MALASLQAGRQVLLDCLHAAGIDAMGDRQAVAKAIAVEQRDRDAARLALEPPPLPAAVYYPPRRALRPPPSGPPDRTSRSQPGFCQDVRALQWHDWKREGFYLDIGVHDAVSSNNTWLLDEAYGWSGLSIDPQGQRLEQRSCGHCACALASTSGTAQFSCDGGPFSGLTEFATSEAHNGMWADLAQRMETRTVQTRTPLECLQLGGAPTTIDYMSLDVEGSEMDIIRAFPFEAYTFLFATIETNNDAAKEAELRAYLKERGYTFLGHAAVDDYFCFGEPAERSRRLSPGLERIH